VQSKLVKNLQYYRKENSSFRSSEEEFQRFLQEFYIEDEDLEFSLKRIREAALVKYQFTTTTVEETKQTKVEVAVEVESY